MWQIINEYLITYIGVILLQNINVGKNKGKLFAKRDFFVIMAIVLLFILEFLKRCHYGFN